MKSWDHMRYLYYRLGWPADPYRSTNKALHMEKPSADRRSGRDGYALCSLLGA